MRTAPALAPLRSETGARALRIGGTLLVVAIAGLVLHHLSREVPLREVRDDLANLDAATLARAALTTAIGYLGMALYDVLAIATVARGRVPRRIAAVTGAAGYALSNVLGFAYLTGSALRFRVYGRFGLNWAQIAAVVTLSFASLWIGVATLTGGLMIAHPAGLLTALRLPGWLDTALGTALLLAVAALLFWLSARPRTLRAAGRSLPLPSGLTALAQIGAAVLDVAGAALTLYVLLPADAAGAFPQFFVLFVAATVLGILSQSPGGLGVFEAAMLTALGAAGRADVLAALAAYRLVYFGLPFLLTLLGAAALYGFSRRHAAGRIGRIAFQVLEPLVPSLMAALILASGAILTISGGLPEDIHRLALLRGLLPLAFVEVSHLAASVTGLLLIIVARGLYRKRRTAWLAAIVLLLVGFIAELTKGFDWEVAASLALLTLLLWSFRAAFYRQSVQSLWRLTPGWILAAAGVLAVAVWIGLLAHTHVPYSNELWWKFTWAGDAPRFLRALLALGIVFVAVVINSLVTAGGAALPPEPIPEAVRTLVAAAPSAEANIALTGDKRFLLAPGNTAYLAYADTGGTLVAKGDPVGDPRAGEALLWRLRELGDGMGRRVAFYAVSPAYLPTYLDMGLSLLKIGEIARVDLSAFSLDGPARKDFRYARGRATREGMTFEVLPAAAVPTLYPELEAVSDDWLALKHGEEKGFALGAMSLPYLSNFDVAVLRQGPVGPVLAFANLFQSGGRAELSIDLMRHTGGAPGYVMDALFAEIMLWGKAQGFAWFSLGAAPLAGMAEHRLSTVWNRLANFIYEHGEHFYNFEGLRAFKQKFDPVWSPNYLAAPSGIQGPRVLFEINTLISGGLRGLVT